MNQQNTKITILLKINSKHHVMGIIRNNWTTEEILEIYDMPLLELVYRASTLHRQYNDPTEVQVSSLLSIKTGRCSEDCAYCPQSARYKAEIEIEKLLDVPTVIAAAKQAKESGSSRFCMGAAWREVKDDAEFDLVLQMVKQVNDLGMEVCCTLGMLTQDQAKKLKEAGLYAYNHNLDSSKEFYKKIITTRSYEERLQTLEHVRNFPASLITVSINVVRCFIVSTLFASNLPIK